MGGGGRGGGGNTKRKKFHDKDKYYNLAKEQGLRSRAAFKLSQIYRQVPTLFQPLSVTKKYGGKKNQNNNMTILDLCAAPGGWTQMAARLLQQEHSHGIMTGGGGKKKRQHNHIIAVDILPIRSLASSQGPNTTITTIIGDITTDQCKADVNRAVQQHSSSMKNSRHAGNDNDGTDESPSGDGSKVHVVLHDGAPNVGASFEKDAYVQLELTVHALRCATQHLQRGGTFVTKVYRSKDVMSLVWVLQQLFVTVTAIKPKASRSQSAEIYYICQNYHCPDKIDPKLLDPKYIFEHVAGDTTGGGNYGGGGANDDDADGAGGVSKFNVFHKNWDTSKRQRGGYDMTHLDATMRHIEPLKNFFFVDKNDDDDDDDTNDEDDDEEVDSDGEGTDANGKKKDDDDKKKKKKKRFSFTTPKQAIQVLSRCTGFSFTGEVSQLLLNHPLTTPEIKHCVTDLKVLNKSDFKGLMIWRERMVQVLQAKYDREDGNDDDDDDEDDNIDFKKKIRELKKKQKKIGRKREDDEDGDDDEMDEEDEEELIQREIQELQDRQARQQKKLQKKTRKLKLKRRKLAAMAMNTSIDIDEDGGGFGNGGGDLGSGTDQLDLKLFSLSMLKSKDDLDKVAHVDLDQVTDEQILVNDEDDDDDDGSDVENNQEAKNDDGNDDDDDDDDIDERVQRLEMDLDDAYDRYLETTKNSSAKQGTKASKRKQSKVLLRETLARENQEESEAWLSTSQGMDYDSKAYTKMLTGINPDDNDDDEERNSDDDDGSSSSDSDDDDDVRRPKRKKAKTLQKQTNEQDQKEEAAAANPLIHQFPDTEQASVKTARWFSNPLFASIGESIEKAQADATATAVKAKPSISKRKMKKQGSDRDNNDDDDDDDNDSEVGDDETDEIEEESRPSKKKKMEKNKKEAIKSKQQQKKRGKKSSSSSSSDGDDDDDDDRVGLNAMDILASMPKTDKEKRHEKRIKARERDLRRQGRKAQRTGEQEGDFEMVAATNDDGDDDDDDENQDLATKMQGMSEERKQKLLQARKLIQAGMGISASGGGGGTSADKNTKFEIVGQDHDDGGGDDLPILDSRRYDSDHEEYDSDDYAETLALGTMMVRSKSKAKALVDASYNRYSWNDPSDLPEWFVDDENRHYRPQLPIPPALVAKMKEKMLALSTKPIAKVAEARARKNRKAKMKLAAAKKKAQAVANSSELSETMKLKSISKALRSSGGDALHKNGKKYVVAKKGRKGVKGATMVDKRMKNDKRSMERSSKKKKGGKRGGLTGSKRRRHHS